MTFTDWLLFGGWVALIALSYRVAVKPSGRLDEATRAAIRATMPVRHERRRDKRSGGR